MKLREGNSPGKRGMMQKAKDNKELVKRKQAMIAEALKAAMQVEDKPAKKVPAK